MVDVPELPAQPPRSEVSSVIADPTGPVLFFDAAPTFGFVDGIVRITLTSYRTLPIEGGGVRAEPVVVAYLRCGRGAATDLRNALNQALLAGTQTQGEA